jgi:hypothetical protein
MPYLPDVTFLAAAIIPRKCSEKAPEMDGTKILLENENWHCCAFRARPVLRLIVEANTKWRHES